MTIASFCLDQLAHGPLPLDELTRRVVDAGLTRSRTPESSVRSAIAYSAVGLPDGRWASPAQLMEGRWLTTRDLTGRRWAYDEGGAHHDLAPLRQVVRAQPVPLATGGVLRMSRYGGGWDQPDAWAALERGPDQLYALGLLDGVLHVQVIDQTPPLRDRGHTLALALGRLDEAQRYWTTVAGRIGENLLNRLWELAAAGADVLARPAPPLSECVPSLTAALRAEAELRREEDRHWRPALDLPAELQQIAIDAAREADTVFIDWLSSFVADHLRDLSAERGRESPYDDRIRLLRP